jgi:hypothetical protein
MTVKHNRRHGGATARSEIRTLELAPHDLPPGRLAEAKTESCDPDGMRSPVGDEVESAHLLANAARPLLRALGLGEAEVLRYADDFVAEDRGNSLEEFVDWAVFVHRKRSGQHAPVG